MKYLLSHSRRYIAVVSTMIKVAWQASNLFLIALIVLQILQGIIPLIMVWITKAIFDLLSINFQNRNFTQIPRMLFVFLAVQSVLSIISQILFYLNDFLNAELGRKLSLSIQSRVFDKINCLQGLSQFETPHFYDTIQLATQKAQYGPEQMLDVLINLIRSIATLIGFLATIIVFNPFLAGLVLIAAIPQLFVQFKMGSKRFTMEFQNTPKERFAIYYGNLLSAIEFAKEIRLFNLGGYFLKAFQNVTIDLQNAQRNQQLKEIYWQSALSLLTSIVSAGTFVVVVLQAFSGGISLGDVALYTSAVGTVQAALSGTILALAKGNESTMFFTFYIDLLALPQTISIPSLPHRILPLVSSIEFRNVSFRYSEKHPWILRNIFLTISVGQCLAIVGLNGVGKTTLVKLLTRMYDPSEGQILWDGVDIREFDPVELRRKMGVIFQDFVHYDLTVQENIGLGDVADIENEQRVHRAAQIVGIHETLKNLPEGYQTVLSRWLTENENGIDLSGGEWQKIALARMFMRDADVLILDEPTAALDAQAEYDVYSHFVELVSGKTSLLISHRFSTVRMADMIAVLEDGKVSEYGSHEQLVSLGGTYAKLYNMQANMYK